MQEPKPISEDDERAVPTWRNLPRTGNSTARMAVPGGWLYRQWTTHDLSICFVPDAKYAWAPKGGISGVDGEVE